MFSNLMIHKHFICFTATGYVFIVYCKTHKILLICMASKCAQLRKLQYMKIKIKLLHYRNYISIYLRSHNDQNPQVEEMVMGRLTYWEIFLYIPQAQWAVSRRRSQFIVGQKFYIWDSFLVPIEHMEWLADISQVVVVNVMICRTHL